MGSWMYQFTTWFVLFGHFSINNGMHEFLWHHAILESMVYTLVFFGFYIDRFWYDLICFFMCKRYPDIEVWQTTCGCMHFGWFCLDMWTEEVIESKLFQYCLVSTKSGLAWWPSAFRCFSRSDLLSTSGGLDVELQLSPLGQSQVLYIQSLTKW